MDAAGSGVFALWDSVNWDAGIEADAPVVWAVETVAKRAAISRGTLNSVIRIGLVLTVESRGFLPFQYRIFMVTYRADPFGESTASQTVRNRYKPTNHPTDENT